MLLTTAPDRARWAARLRLGVLALVALLSAHTAIYVVAYGVGDQFNRAMAAGGHDGWWVPASAIILGVGLVLLVQTLGGLAHLEARARAGRRVDGGGHAPFQSEIGSIWRRLLPLVTILFLVQENIEHLLAHGQLLGLYALVGPVLPILAAITLGLSVLGALVRWRVAVLRARTSAPANETRRAVADRVVGGRWRTIGALAPRSWMTDRLDAGRAPPILLRP